MEKYYTLLIKNKRYGTQKVLLDMQDKELVEKHSWRLYYQKRYTYPITNIKKDDNRSTISMHRLIMNPPKGYVVDHINRNPLDNRRDNLRICTNQQNLWNSGTAKKKYKGVYKYKSQKGWVARILYNEKLLYLGKYNTEFDAAIVYNGAAKLLFGEYAYLNSFEDVRVLNG